MRTVVIGDPPPEVQAWLEARRKRGQDLFDEIWEGVNHVAPAPHLRHGVIENQVVELLSPRARAVALTPSGPLNIGGPNDYRVPDRAFVRELPGSAFVPTAAIVVEIVSPGNETYDKFGFYFERGVEELLVVDSPPGAVEWYERAERGFERTGASRLLGLSDADVAARIDWPPTD